MNKTDTGGFITRILIKPGQHSPLHSVQQATAVRGQGLEGDYLSTHAPSGLVMLPNYSLKADAAPELSCAIRLWANLYARNLPRLEAGQHLYVEDAVFTIKKIGYDCPSKGEHKICKNCPLLQYTLYLNVEQGGIIRSGDSILFSD